MPLFIKRKRRQKLTMNTNSRNICRFGRLPVEQGSHPLLGDQGRGEKLATGKLTSMKATEKLKIAKNTLTIETWNIQTLWATGKLELLRNEMKRFRHDIAGISEVRWAGKGETSNTVMAKIIRLPYIHLFFRTFFASNIIFFS